MLKDVSPDASLDDMLAAARAEFGPLDFEDVHLGSVELKVLQIQDMPGYLDKLVNRARPGESVQLPLWAKLWTPALIQGMFLQRHAFRLGAEVLEIGAGCGLSGLATAARGFSVLLTDVEPAALLFCRINILKNGLAERAQVARADFTRDRLGRRFDCILGCEVLYDDAVYPGLLDFLDAHLAPGPEAEILLALDCKRSGKGFFSRAKERFQLMRKDVPFTDPASGEKTVTCLYRLGAPAA